MLLVAIVCVAVCITSYIQHRYQDTKVDDDDDGGSE